MILYKRIKDICFFIVFLSGLCFVLYPSFSNQWNTLRQSKAIAGYQELTASLNEEMYEKILNNAKAYNQNFKIKNTTLLLTEDEKLFYEKQLNIAGDGLMGYLQIPSIHIKLPIYHGTDEAVLRVAVGHVEGTSLPVGGKGTHCVLSGHSGLPSAKLFTDLEKLSVGAYFSVHILNETLEYQIDQIKIVKPEDITQLMQNGEKDYCTLVTCTPYGINTHRLLVRGVRK